MKPKISERKKQFAEWAEQRKTGNKQLQPFNAWKSLKSKYPDTLLLLQTGLTYTTFETDAKKLNRICKTRIFSINGISYCEFSKEAVDRYLRILTRAGQKVGIYDQLNIR
jgi:DNA mismatch repair ATPase MutS